MALWDSEEKEDLCREESKKYFIREKKMLPFFIFKDIWDLCYQVWSGLAVLQSAEHSKFVDMGCVCVYIHFQPLIQGIMTKLVKRKSQYLKKSKFY